jgi:hypothetical protein
MMAPDLPVPRNLEQRTTESRAVGGRRFRGGLRHGDSGARPIRLHGLLHESRGIRLDGRSIAIDRPTGGPATHGITPAANARSHH